VRPRSRCPACRSPIAAADNVPVLSWWLLGGRCRGCKARIAFRYPAVELTMAVLAAVTTYVLVVAPGRGLDATAWAHAVVVIGVTAALLAASLIDADHRILPDRITKPGMWAAPVVSAFVPELHLAAGVPPWVPAELAPGVQSALVSVAGLALGGGSIWILGVVGTRVFRKDAMGFGDVKFLAMIGGFVGPWGAILALVLAAFAGSLGGFVRILLTRDRYIAFGPFLSIGAYVVLLYGTTLVDWYAGLLQLN
jgi:leader peptidase (prepilin peptidase)/N-methyltransferase